MARGYKLPVTRRVRSEDLMYRMMVTVNNTAIYLEVAKRVVKKEMIIM